MRCVMEIGGESFRVGSVKSLGGPLALVLGDLVVIVASGDEAIDIEHARQVVQAMQEREK
jgi:hypothetical protein